ncbi:unnamed protein product [Porites lobata]|uniref:Uncharacterized protein n=1 Tax=Porites lobata TaxID=104759 RepID=A0ABN8PLF7_9CNID|nr:unnamed protein product [Porites lobata]
MRKAQGKKDDYSRSIEKQAPGFKCLSGQTESNQKKVNLKHDEIMTLVLFLKLYSMNFAVAEKQNNISFHGLGPDRLLPFLIRKKPVERKRKKGWERGKKLPRVSCSSVVERLD